LVFKLVENVGDAFLGHSVFGRFDITLLEGTLEQTTYLCIVQYEL